MEYIIEILISFLIPLVFIIKPLKETIKNKQNIKNIIKKYQYEIIVYFIILVGSLVRLAGLHIFPQGLNADETSSGYEAWSILNYGIDRNLKSYPVFLISWGSGQNALYTYILIPFIKIFGLTEFATRLPMAIISSMSLVVIYYMCNELSNKKMAMLATFFLAICPWHIMKSRYGLESNIFPDIILLATTYIIFFIKREKISYIYIAFAILGLSAYSYGTSYFFLPFYVIPLLIYLIISKKLKIRHAIIALTILMIIAMPIIMMVIINTFDLPEFKIFGVFTVPRLVSNRYEELCPVFSNQFLSKSISNFKEGMKIVLLQNDTMVWNAIPVFGVFYIFSIPFTILGIMCFIMKDKKIENKVINFWCIASFLMLFAVEPNMVRINIIWIPLIIYTIYGIDLAFGNKKVLLSITITTYIIYFSIFEFTYMHTKFSYPAFIDDAKEVIKYLDNKDTDIYIEYTFKEPYIYFMFYNRMSPYVTKEYFSEHGIFANVKSINNYHFYISKDININDIYVLKENSNSIINYREFNKIKIQKYIILEPKIN